MNKRQVISGESECHMAHVERPNLHLPTVMNTRTQSPCPLTPNPTPLCFRAQSCFKDCIGTAYVRRHLDQEWLGHRGCRAVRGPEGLYNEVTIVSGNSRQPHCICM